MFMFKSIIPSIKIDNMIIEVPIIQGGMGVGVSLSKLASAVANQGGVGVISAVGIGMTEPDYITNFRQANKIALSKEIQKARKLSFRGQIGVNIMMAVSDFDDLFAVAVHEKADMLFIGAGLFLKLPENITFDDIDKSGTKIIPKVSSARAANVIFDYWSRHYNRVPDAVAIEGPLAGGHLGFKKVDLINNTYSLSEIVEETVKVINVYREKYHKDIPIIAGGGIYTGKDIVNIMNSGANAVKMGTRFVTTYECDADIKFKNEYLNASEKDITIIQSPVGLPGRAIKNDFLNKVESGEKIPVKCPWKCLITCNYKESPYCIAQALFNAAQGKMDGGFAFCGSNAYRATKIQSVKELFDELLNEYEFYSENKIPLKAVSL